MTINSVRRTFTIACAIGLSLAGCSSASQPTFDRTTQQSSDLSVQAHAHAAVPGAKAPSPPPQSQIATAAPVGHPGIKLALNSLHRDSAGVVALTWTITNNSQQPFNAGSGTFNSISEYSGDGVSDVTLLDADHKIRYHPLRDGKTNYCVCTVMNVTGAHTTIPPGGSATYYDTYTLPGDASRATVEIPGFTGVKNVPIN